MKNQKLQKLIALVVGVSLWTVIVALYVASYFPAREARAESADATVAIFSSCKEAGLEMKGCIEQRAHFPTMESCQRFIKGDRTSRCEKQ